MSPTAEQLLASVLALPPGDRAELADALRAAEHPPAPEPRGDEWLAELARRSAGPRSGDPWHVVRDRVRGAVGGG